MRLLPILLAALLVLPLPAMAASKKLGSFGAWQTFRITEGNQDLCYMVQRPAKPDFKPAKGDKLKRGAAALMITLRPAEGLNPTVSYDAGYIFKPSSEAVMMIGKTKFSLFTEKASAWARSGTIDKAITNALRKATSLSIAGTSTKGSHSLDTFDLKGSDPAYAAIAKACGIK